MRRENSESLTRYFKSIMDLNPLTKEVELELARKAIKGDTKSRDKLIKHNLKIVITIANKNIGRGILIDDLIQQGNIGLYEASLRFDPDQNVRFASFAGKRILKSINQLIDTCGRIVRIPVNQEYDRYLAKKAGKEVTNITPVKIDDFVRRDENDGETKAGRILNVEPDVYVNFEQREFKDKIDKLLNTLSDRDRDIVKLYFGIDADEEVPTKDIAKEVGLTQIRVCQIIAASKKHLKKTK